MLLLISFILKTAEPKSRGLEKRRLDEEDETVQKSFVGTFDLADHHLGNWLEGGSAEKNLGVLVGSQLTMS